jgi:hypothetical protein
MSSYRPHLTTQLEKLHVPIPVISNTTGVGTMLATQLVLRYRFGNI